MPRPLYSSWADFIAGADPWEVRDWCAEKAKLANKRAAKRGVAGKVTTADVFAVLLAAKGRCCYCGSLAVEAAPLDSNGHLAAWQAVGRRIGSLEHVAELFRGGANERVNLRWACYTCNTGHVDRVVGATDRGGIQTGAPDDAVPCGGHETVRTPTMVFTLVCGWCC